MNVSILQFEGIFENLVQKIRRPYLLTGVEHSYICVTLLGEGAFEKDQ